MEQKKRYLTVIILVAAIWLILTIFCWIKPTQEESDSERRKLEQFPEFTIETLMSGKFTNNFEKYTLDQFPMRDSFRTLKSISSFYVFAQKDNNGIYISDGYASKLEYPLNENSIISAADKFNYLYKKYMKGKDMNIILSVVPDKGYFLAEENGYPSLDYEKLIKLIKENTGFAEYIDIIDTLELSDYYKTDTHWKQEGILDTAKRLAEALGIADRISENYEKKTADVPFYGVYYGQSALPLKSDSISYLTNDILDSCIVYNTENGNTSGIYDIDKLSGRDPYEMFLSGAVSVLNIENPNSENDKELIVFRDSFGSSLVPLLAEGYSRITLIDTRYITSDLVGEYVDFDDQDVMFLYSTLILNSSTILK